jgi:transmembrane 9 superfamily protein 2/4
VNSIPRQIPPAPSYLKPIPSAFLSGILPFGAAFIEGYFLLSSIFASRAYYAFGFLALTSAVVTVATATVTILFVYFLLCAEDYRWQWRSFLAGGGSALWLLLYGVYYWVSRMSLDSLASVVLYFGYLLLACMMNFIITGACWTFVCWCKVLIRLFCQAPSGS